MKRLCRQGAVIAAAVVLATAAACSSPEQTGSSVKGAAGEPVQGGSATALVPSEPRTMDPATMLNVVVGDGALGNALYGTLVTADPVTGKIKPSMARMTTADSGATWKVKLREGLKFSDGTAFDAAAVKFNWDRMKDPKVASPYLATAASIKKSKVIDPTTLEFSLTVPNASYPSGITVSSMNWIASPTALKKGAAGFDRKPVGAGPYVLDTWQRGAQVKLKRNQGYWEKPKPYLDALTIKLVTDGEQRLNTLRSGGADVTLAGNPKQAGQAKSSGLVVEQQRMNGGSMLLLNMARAPFNDPRAREALSKAIDVDQLNSAALDGTGTPVKGLFTKKSPLFTGHQLHTHDAKRAQKLFDELAADGKRLRLTITCETARASEVEAIQAQLSSYKNVTVKVRTVDAAANVKTMLSKDFDALYSGNVFVDPETSVWSFFYGASPFNSIGLDDAQVNKGLDIGRSTADVPERKRGYDLVQKRMEELNPAIFTLRLDNLVFTSKSVGGVRMYGLGSLLVQDLWVKQ